MQEKIQKISPIKQRILQFIEYLNISKRDFYSATGISRGTLESNTGITEGTLAKIFATYPNLSKEWVNEGVGEMINSSTIELKELVHKYNEHKDGIPLIPISAMAGTCKGDSCVLEADVIERYVVPEFKEKGVRYLIRVSGASMYPKYSNGDLLACRPVSDLSFFQWGKVYVLDTEQGALVKRLFPCLEDNECLECRSDNSENYPPFRISKSSVRQVALVVGVIRLE